MPGRPKDLAVMEAFWCPTNVGIGCWQQMLEEVDTTDSKATEIHLHVIIRHKLGLASWSFSEDWQSALLTDYIDSQISKLLWDWMDCLM